MKYGQSIKKTCVVVGNCTGFCVNRVFAPYTQAACILLDAGMDPYLIDKVIAGFGMPMGPFRCCLLPRTSAPAHCTLADVSALHKGHVLRLCRALLACESDCDCGVHASHA